MAQYSIHDVEMISGVKAHTLRIWEQRYDFIKPHRSDTNIRSYTDDQLRLLLNVSILVKNGMRISKVAELTTQELNEHVIKTAEKEQPADQLTDHLVHAMMDFDEMRFEKILSDAVIKYGFEKAFTTAMIPFIIRIGTLWSTGTASTAQEHFMSNLIRRKIIAATDGLYPAQNDKASKFLLFLPEGETHELLLLFTEYLLRKNNHKVVYLGNSIPYPELEFAYHKLKPEFLFTYMTVHPVDMTAEEYIKQLTRSFPAAKILISGAQAQNIHLNKGARVKVINSEAELMKAIS